MFTKKAMSLFVALAAAATGSAFFFPSPAHAGLYAGDAGRTAVWVFVRAYKGEDVWETCRRVYQRDVYQVRGAGRGKARCFIDASRVSDPRGKNLSRELR
jgi:hypothetical protein